MCTETSHCPKSFRKDSWRSSKSSGPEALIARIRFWHDSRSSKSSSGVLAKCAPKSRCKYSSRSVNYSSPASGFSVEQFGEDGFSTHSSVVSEPELELELEQAKKQSGRANKERTVRNRNVFFIQGYYRFFPDGKHAFSGAKIPVRAQALPFLLQGTTFLEILSTSRAQVSIHRPQNFRSTSAACRLPVELDAVRIASSRAAENI